MDFRALHGEKITGESWLLRDKFDTTTTDKNGKGAKRSLATRPKKLSVGGIKKILIYAMRRQGLHQHLEEAERRYEFKLSHGFRKYFKTNAERAGMLAANVEMLMNHAIGTSDSYYRPTEQQLQDDYIKIVDYLIINKDEKIANQLQKEVTELKEEREQDKYAIMGKLAEKEKEIEEMKTRQIAFEQMLKKMFVYEYDIDIDLNNPDVLESESLEEILRRVNISDRRLLS